MRRRDLSVRRAPRWPHGCASGLSRAMVWIAVLGLAGCSVSGSRSRNERPNIVLISVDTLRADRLSVYGYARPTSPNLEVLAAEAVVFESFVNNGGGTLPSHLTMMTSLHPGAHGVSATNGRALAVEEKTLAEYLREAGYATGAFVDSGWMRGRFGFVQGFDLYDDQGGHFKATMPKARRWLHRNRDRRFFLFLHTYDVHSKSEEMPYECPSNFPRLYTSGLDVDFEGCQGRRCASRLLAFWNEKIKAGHLRASDVLEEEEIEYMSALYDGCINYVDEQIGHLLQELKDLSLYDKSLIAITSDHGEEFAEHGLFMHTQGGYEELAHIPLIIKLPYSAYGGHRIPYLAAMVDLMPTVMEIVGIAGNDRVQGTSLLPTLSKGEKVRQATHLYPGPGEVISPLRAVRTQTWKYIDNRQELYDLAADPGESNNVFDREREVAKRLDRYFQNQLYRDEELLRTRNAEMHEEVELSPQEIRQLEALGYLQ